MRPSMLQSNRRDFLQISAATGLLSTLPFVVQAETQQEKLRSKIIGQVGITTSSLSRQVSVKPTEGKIALMDLPKVLREELNIKVIDLNTSTIAGLDDKGLDKFRQAAEKAGSLLINLKMNQKGVDMSSPDADLREKTMRTYKRSIDAAARLGCLWARPLPRPMLSDRERHIAAYQELAEYAKKKNVQMLVENYGWMETDPQSVVKLIKAIGKNVAACPDTGNWKSNDLRAAGLKATFPIAVTCDYKAKVLSKDFEHPAYDLKQCFEIGWDAGFRGPWCLEHAHADQKTVFRNLAWLRDQLHQWMKEKTAVKSKLSNLKK